MSLEASEKVVEEATSREVADACKGVLDIVTCDEIAEQEDVGDALSLAYTALLEHDIDDPEAFFIERGICIAEALQ